MTTKLKPAPVPREAVQQEMARRSLLKFTEYTFPDYRANWHHALVAKYLDKWMRGEIQRLIITEPPQHGKSEQVSRRTPAKLLGDNPDLRIISASYSTQLAHKMNRAVQRIIDTKEYRDIYPNTRLSAENIRSNAFGSWLRNTDEFEIVDRRGSYRSAGVGSGITGMPADYGIIDDPIKSRKEAESAVIRESIWEWYTDVFRSRMSSERASILVTQTRWHEDDLVGRLLQQQEEEDLAEHWVLLNIPAIRETEFDTVEEDPRSIGDALWPDRYSEDYLATTRVTMGSYAFSALYQGRPTPLEGGSIKARWFKFYKALPQTFDQVMQSWDCAFKDTETSSYVVGQVWGKNGPDRYLLDQVRKRLTFTETLDEIGKLRVKWPQTRGTLIEDKANGTAVIDVLKQKYTGIIARNPTDSKFGRLQAVSPIVEAGNVWLPEYEDFTDEFVREVTQIPFYPTDDQADAFSQMLDYWDSGYRPGGFAEYEEIIKTIKEQKGNNFGNPIVNTRKVF